MCTLIMLGLGFYRDGWLIGECDAGLDVGRDAEWGRKVSWLRVLGVT